MFETIGSTTLLLALFLILVAGGVIALTILPFLGVNLKEKVDKIFKKNEGIEEEKSSFRLMNVNTNDPSILYDPQTNRKEEINAFAIRQGGAVSLFTKREDGERVLFVEAENESQIQPRYPLKVLLEGGHEFILAKDHLVSKLKKQLEVRETQVKILEKEKEKVLTMTSKANIVQSGELMKETRKAAYGNTSNPFSQDKFGYGGNWRRFGGRASSGEEEQEEG